MLTGGQRLATTGAHKTQANSPGVEAAVALLLLLGRGGLLLGRVVHLREGGNRSVGHEVVMRQLSRGVYLRAGREEGSPEEGSPGPGEGRGPEGAGSRSRACGC